MLKHLLIFLGFAPVVFGFISPAFQSKSVVGSSINAANDENENKGGFFSGVKNFFEELDAFGEPAFARFLRRYTYAANHFDCYFLCTLQWTMHLPGDSELEPVSMASARATSTVNRIK